MLHWFVENDIHFIWYANYFSTNNILALLVVEKIWIFSLKTFKTHKFAINILIYREF